MSDNNNGIIIAGLIVAYLYMKRTQAGAVVVTTKAPTTMPASVGSGTKQIAVGALQGLLQALASGPANNTSQTYFPSQQFANTSGVVQEAVPAMPDDMSSLMDSSTDYYLV